jgi:hypothetical protein
MGKKGVHKLSSDPGQTLALLGISSHENDYRLSWGMNENLGFRLVKTDNHKSFNTRLNEFQEFSAYCYTENEYSTTYRLIANRCDNGFLLDELKNIDYLLLVEPSDPSFEVKGLMANIRLVPFISAVFVIDLNSLKNKKRLL